MDELTSLDLVNYQNKCRLIRGWDDLFAKCSENLNSLQAMRHSPVLQGIRGGGLVVGG